MQRQVKRYVRYGLDCLKNEPKGGRTCTLTEGQHGTLARDARLHPENFGYAATSWSGCLLAFHLEEKYGFSLSVRQYQRLLKQPHN
jgi:transposase